MIYHPTAQSLVHNIRKVDAKITSNLPELQQKALQAAATSPLDLCGKPLARDPFIFEEMDMKLCKADESSLWELYVRTPQTTASDDSRRSTITMFRR